jgi:hypothetical protein
MPDQDGRKSDLDGLFWLTSKLVGLLYQTCPNIVMSFPNGDGVANDAPEPRDDSEGHMSMVLVNGKKGDAATVAGADPNPKGPEVPKGLQFLKADGGEQMVIFEKWESLQARQDVDTQFRRVQYNVGFNVNQLADMLPNFSSEDLIICKRDDAVEVWTRRDFAKGELVLAPETHEIKDRYWTAGRSVLCEGGCNHHPSKKHIVLDGRMRAIPMPGGSRPFSIFFCIQRGEPCNMVLGMTSVTLDVKVALPFQKTPLKRCLKDGDVVQVPVAYNPNTIKKHTKLVLMNDKQLQKVDDDIKKQSMKAAEDQIKGKGQAKANAKKK